MKKSLAIYIIVLALGAMQAQAVEYKNTYSGHRSSVGSSYKGGYQATTPSVSFQSTSVYSGQLSAEGVSLVNADGSVNTEAYMGNTGSAKVGPRKVTGTPGGNPEDDDQQPLGDGLLVLMILAGGYGMRRARLARSNR